MKNIPDKKDLCKALWIIVFGLGLGLAWNALNPRGINFRIALGLYKTPPADAGK